jgi:hypothetical protein
MSQMGVYSVGCLRQAIRKGDCFSVSFTTALDLKFKYQNPYLRRNGFAQAGKFQMNDKWFNVKTSSYGSFRFWILFELGALTFDI